MADEADNPRWVVRGRLDGKRLCVSHSVKRLPYWVVYIDGWNIRTRQQGWTPGILLVFN